jgi:hypothetical protein
MRPTSSIAGQWITLAVFIRDALTRAFWRLSAHLLAFALQYRPSLARALPYIPYTAAGLMAFMLGRLIGRLALY